MKPILNAEDVKKLKIDEQLIECSCGKVNAERKSKVDDNTARMQSIKQLGV